MLDMYWNILTMHVTINVKSRNIIIKWQMGFNSAFKGLIEISAYELRLLLSLVITICS
jgi:hypothetical protein